MASSSSFCGFCISGGTMKMDLSKTQGGMRMRPRSPLLSTFRATSRPHVDLCAMQSPFPKGLLKTTTESIHASCMAISQKTSGSSSEEDKAVERLSPVAPNAFEVQYLLTELCDKTSIAEFELKLEGFKLYIKRDVEKMKDLVPSPAVHPPINTSVKSSSINSTVPMTRPASDMSKPTTVSATSSFLKLMSLQKLLDTAEDEGMHFVTSPTVGFFKRARTVKGRQGLPMCEEGQTIKGGQVVCYVQQLGTQQPVEQGEVAGEVVRILKEDGDPVGYGDPLIAILPSFPGIKKLN